MAAIAKLVMSLWPFLREMIMKDKASRQFVEQNRHSLYTTTAAVILFLLFFNAYIKNVTFSEMVLEARREAEYHKERHDSLMVRHLELKADHANLRRALFQCAGIPDLRMMMAPGTNEPGDKPPIPIPQDRTDVILNPGIERKRLDPDPNKDLNLDDK